MILEVALGVVIGGIILFVLAAFAEPLLRLAAWTIGIALGLVALTASLAIIYEVWRGIVSLANHEHDNVAQGFAVIAVLIAGGFCFSWFEMEWRRPVKTSPTIVKSIIPEPVVREPEQPCTQIVVYHPLVHRAKR